MEALIINLNYFLSFYDCMRIIIILKSINVKGSPARTPLYAFKLYVF